MVIDFKGMWDDFLNPKITRKRFDALAGLAPKRICFGSTHSKALKKADSGVVGYFNVPFFETIGALFPWDIYKNKFGYSRTIKGAAEFGAIEAWIAANREVVFIRSLLETCVAASEHLGDEGRSEIGELEYRAKWRGDDEAVARLAQILVDIFRRLHSASGIDAICAIPASTPGDQSLPC